METRKIVRSGNTSFILALPINWIRKNNLESGKLVQVFENEQGDLLISAEKRKIASKDEIVTIKVDGKDEETINLDFSIAYIRDASSIIFEGKEIISKTSKILENIQFFIGLDVMEQSTRSIVVKNFFSLDKETSPYTLIKKMDIVNRAGFEQLQIFFNKNFANEDFFELQKLTEQNRRLFVLVRKSILKLIEYPSLMRNIQTDYLQVSKDKTFAHILRTISAALLSLGKTFLFLDRSRSEIKVFKEIFNSIYSDYQALLNAINNKIYEDIQLFIKRHNTKSKEIEKFSNSLEDPLMIQAVTSLLQVYSSLKDMAYETLT